MQLRSLNNNLIVFLMTKKLMIMEKGKKNIQKKYKTVIN